MMVWVPVPIVGGNMIPALAPGATHDISGTFSGAGLYRVRITGVDPVPANDVKTKVLP